MPQSGAARLLVHARRETNSLTAEPRRIEGVAVWRNYDTLGSSRRKRGRPVDRTSGAVAICITNLACG
jgi:hypothetical protein